MAGRVDRAAERRVGPALREREQLHRARQCWPPRRPRARRRPGRLEQALDDQLAGDREDQQRHDQVGAAALVLLGGVRRVEAAALVGADRLVLDAVVGGEVGSRQRRRAPGARPARRSRVSRAAVAGARAGGCSAARDAAVASATPSTRGSSIGSRAAGRPRRAIGITAKASASRSGPRRSGASSRAGPARRPASAPRRPRCGRRACVPRPPRRRGPWISRPLRSAIPPSRSFSGAAGALPLAEAPLVETRGRSARRGAASRACSDPAAHRVRLAPRTGFPATAGPPDATRILSAGERSTLRQRREEPRRPPAAAGDAPLAVRMRPRELEELVGQEHVLGRGVGAADGDRDGQPQARSSTGRPGRARRRWRGSPPARAEGAFEEESAVNAGRAEIRAVIERAAGAAAGSGRPTVLFLDEIHRFNKAQQDALLPAVEEGLADADRGDDREPLLRGQLGAALALPDLRAASRSTPEQVEELLRRALADPERGLADPPPVEDEALAMLGRAQPAATPGSRSRRSSGRSSAAGRASGRRRRGRGRAAAQGDRLRPRGRPPLRLHLGLDQGDPRLRRRRLALLPGGDARGRRGPALHRPPDGHPRLRGRRQRRPAGAARRRRAARAVDRVGLPECALNLAQAAVYLALAPKSNASYKALAAARAEVREPRRPDPARLPPRRPLPRRREARPRRGLPLRPRRAGRRQRPAAAARGGSAAAASTSRPTAASRPSWPSASTGCGRCAARRVPAPRKRTDAIFGSCDGWFSLRSSG